MIRLTLRDAINTALRYNLGAKESGENAQITRGQRLIAMQSATRGERRRIRKGRQASLATHFDHSAGQNFGAEGLLKPASFLERELKGR